MNMDVRTPKSHPQSCFQKDPLNRMWEGIRFSLVRYVEERNANLNTVLRTVSSVGDCKLALD
jgi:hypothetical protein